MIKTVQLSVCLKTTLVCFFLACSTQIWSQKNGVAHLQDKNPITKVVNKLKHRRALKAQENPRAVAAITTVLLGPFGAHRIYLGTAAKVPVFYTLTLGGGLGVLPIIDLVCILSVKEISRYYNNKNVFMWAVE